MLVDEAKVVDACFRVLKPIGVLLISFNSLGFPNSRYFAKRYSVEEGVKLVSERLKVVEAIPYFENGLLLSTFIKAVKE